MSALKTTILTVAATLCFVAHADAQSSFSGSQCGDYQDRYRQVYQGHGYGYGFSPRYTAYNGAADLIRSRATANLLNAQAWSEAESARRHNLENNVLAVETYFEKRRINREARFGHLHARAAAAKAQQTQLAATALDQGIVVDHIKQLTAAELDPATGQLRWPLLLQSRYFAKARQPVDRIFRERAKVGQIHPDDYIPLRNWIERIQTQIHKSVRSLPKEDYALTQDFLRRLAAESRLPAASELTATQLVSTDG